MRPAAIEERVRDYVEAERAQVPVPPPHMAFRILRAVEASRPTPTRRRGGALQFAAGMAFVLLLAAGIAWLRTAQSPAATVLGTWSPAPAMSFGRGYHTATLLPNGEVLVVAGSQSDHMLANAELYDPRTRTWNPAGTLTMPRSLHTATLLNNGKVLVVGGSPIQPMYLGSLATAELYDPQTNSWAMAASMHTPRSYHTATLLADGRVLVVGGIEASNDITGRVLASTELYDPVANSWTVGMPMSVARAKHTATLLADHRVLVVGGTGADYFAFSGYFRTAELYDPATQSWSPAASMNDARINATSTLLPDGRVLVVGDDGVNERTAEIFDPGSGQWLPIPDPAVGRAEQIAVELRDGTVLVAGGIGQTNAQVFDWRRNGWSSAAALTTIRASATATLLDDGQVLVAGGFGNRQIPWASAELFDPHGTSAVGALSRRSATAPMAGTAIILVVGTLALVGVLLFRRGRVVRKWRGGETWID
jgi:Galactose oxidase, central domain/Kelch motif